MLNGLNGEKGKTMSKPLKPAMDQQAVSPKVVKLPKYLDDWVEEEAARLGLNGSQYIAKVLLKALGMEEDVRLLLLEAVADLVRPHGGSYHRHITRTIFKEIQGNKSVMDLYQRATHDDEGNPDEKLKGVVNRQIGKTVLLVLGAKKEGRFDGPLDKDELIKSYAFLIPKTDD